MSGRRGKKWRGNLEGDEFGQEEMRRGETGVKKERGGEQGRGECNESEREMDGKRV